jgi:hypothetical protein
MKTLLGILIIGLLVIAGFYLLGPSTPQSSPDGSNYYSGYIDSVDSELKFTLDCCGQVLHLGMVTVVDTSQENLTKIESLMKKYELQCTAFNRGQRQIDVDTVYCSTEDGLLSGLLINAGLVEENCEQTANQFGTCS